MVETEDSDCSSVVSSDSDSEDDNSADLVSLFAAIHENSFAKAKDIINKNITVINSNLNGSTPLHETIKQRIKCDVNTKDANLCLIQELLQKGADVNAKNQKGESALTIVRKQLKKNPGISDWQSIKTILQPEDVSSTSSTNSKFKKSSKKNSEEIGTSSTTTKLLDPDEQSSSSSKKSSEKDAVGVSKRKTNEDSDVDIKRTKPTTDSYAVSGLKTSLHGTIYQLQLLMLLLYRGVDKYPYFDLATEMNQAEKFDDAVVRYKDSRTNKWIWRFLQAKHKEDVLRDRITINDLLTESDGPFSLQKYFLSFCKIKNNAMFVGSDLAEFDLCTNTDLNLSEKLKRDDDRNLSITAQHHNNLVTLWNSLLEEEKFDDDALLFFRGVNANKLKFKSEAVIEFKKLIKRLFFSPEFHLETLKGKNTIADKVNSMKLIEHTAVVQEVNAFCQKLSNIVSSTKTEKAKFGELPKKILKLKGNFLEDSKYDNLGKIATAFQKTNAKDQNYFTRRSEIYNACGNMLQNITDSLTKAKDKINSFRNTNSSEYRLLNEEIQNVLEQKKQFTEVRNEIWKCPDIISLNDKLINFPNLQKKLETLSKDDSNLDNIREKLSNILEQNISDCVLLELAVDESKLESFLKEFLEKFRLLTCYPDVDKLNVLIKREMGRKFSFLNTDLITDSFQKQILDWFKEYNKGRSEFLSSDKGQKFFESINREIKSIMTSGLNQAYPARLKSFNLHFKHDDLNGFLSSDRNFLYISTKSTRLSAIKVLQVINDSRLYQARDSFIFMLLNSMGRRETQELIVSSFRTHQSHDLLVIECQKQSKNTAIPNIEQFIEDIAGILQQNKNKKFILIGDKVNNIAEELKTFDCVQIQNRSDINTFKDLKKGCQNDLLEQLIIFQNKTIALKKLIGIKSARDIINETVLEDLITNTIQIGDDQGFSSFNYVPEYYQSRYLHLQAVRETVFGIDDSLFFLTNDDHDDDTKHHHVEIWDAKIKYANRIIMPSKDDNYEEVFHNVQEQHSNKSVYWLHQNGGVLFWKRSLSDFKKIQDHIIDNLAISGKGFYYEENIIFPEKIVLVANNPGIGKSTFLTSLSRRMKTNHEDWWICRINLNDHAFEKEFLPTSDNRIYTKSLRELKEAITPFDAVDFISEMVIPQNPHIQYHSFQRELFKKGFRHNDEVNPQVIILFDGFDEISPLFKNETRKLLTKLSNTDVLQMWVTTRVHEKQSLEETFLCPAYLLNPFTDDEQIAFLTNFWCYSLIQKLTNTKASDEQMNTYQQKIKINLKVDEQYLTSFHNLDELLSILNLGDFAARLVHEWKFTASDEKKTFTHNPLQLKMLAEIVFWENFEFIHQIGLTDLFEKFLNMKFNIYYHDKQILGHTVGSMEVRKDHSEPLRQKHRLVALLEIFPDINEELDNPLGHGDDTSNLTRVGLLVRSGIRLIFVHRSFAEYLLSEYLILSLNRTLTQKVLFERLFSEDRHSLMASFFDEFVEKQSLKMTLNDSTIALINNIISFQYRDIFMHQLIFNRFHHTLKFVLITLKQCPEVQEKVLFKPGKYGKFALYDVVYNMVRWLPRLEQIRVIKIFLENLIDQDHILIKFFTERYEELGIMLGSNVPFVTCLQLSLFNTGSEEIFKLFINSIRHKLTAFKDILFRNGLKSGETLLHFSCMFAYEHMQFLLDVLMPLDQAHDHSYIDMLVDLILAKDSSGRTALHWLAYMKRHQIVDIFLTWVKKVSETALFTLLNTVDKMRINPFDMAVYRDSSETTISFLNSMRTNLSSDQFKSLVLQNGPQNSVLYKAVSQGKNDSMIALLEWFKEYFGIDQQGQLHFVGLLMEKNAMCGRTSVTLAAARKFSQTLEKLLYWIRDINQYLTGSLLLQLLQMQDNSGKTILHETTLFSTQSLKVLMKFLIQNFDCQGLAEILLSKDNLNKTSFDYVKNQESKKVLCEGYDIIFATIISLSEILDVSQHNTIFSQEQLTILEEIAQKHIERNNETVLSAIIKLKCLMNYDLNVLSTDSYRAPLLSLPPGSEQ